MANATHVLPEYGMVNLELTVDEAAMVNALLGKCLWGSRTQPVYDVLSHILDSIDKHLAVKYRVVNLLDRTVDVLRVVENE